MQPSPFCSRCGFPLRLIAGKYKLEKRLLEGGFGSIYLAHHARLGPQSKRVVKVVLEKWLDSQEVLARFQREVRVTSVLSEQNDHIVRIYDDFGEEPGLGYYYVMEYLQGITLRDYLVQNGALQPKEMLALVQQICSGMQAAHNAGIIHRDLKPENLFLLSRQRNQHFVKIIDFGIAKHLKSNTGAITQGVMGTPAYMAPEQCLSQSIDARTDVYALGIIVYEMLTGSTPFPVTSGQNMVAWFSHISSEPTSMLERRPGVVTPQLDQAVLKALRKEPDERYPSMESFWEAISSSVQASKPVDLSKETMEYRPNTAQMKGFVVSASSNVEPIPPVSLDPPATLQDMDLASFLPNEEEATENTQLPSEMNPGSPAEQWEPSSQLPSGQEWEKVHTQPSMAAPQHNSSLVPLQRTKARPNIALWFGVLVVGIILGFVGWWAVESSGWLGLSSKEKSGERPTKGSTVSQSPRTTVRSADRHDPVERPSIQRRQTKQVSPRKPNKARQKKDEGIIRYIAPRVKSPPLRKPRKAGTPKAMKFRNSSPPLFKKQRQRLRIPSDLKRSERLTVSSVPSLGQRRRIPSWKTSVERGTPGNSGRFGARSVTLRSQLSRVFPLRSLSLGTPVVVSGNLFVSDISGRVYAFSLRTGQLLWQVKAKSPVRGGVAVSQGLVVFGNSRGLVYAVNSSNGQLVWVARLDSKVEVTPKPYGRSLLIQSAKGSLYNLDASTGQVLWKHTKRRDLKMSAARANQTLVLLDRRCGLHRYRLGRTYKYKYKRVAGCFSQVPPLMVGNVVYTLSTAGLLQAFRPGSLRRLWQIQLPQSLQRFTYPMATDGAHIYIANGLRLIQVALQGRRFREWELKHSARTGPILVGNTLVVGLWRGYVATAAAGKVVSELQILKPFFRTPRGPLTATQRALYNTEYRRVLELRFQ